MQRRAIPGTSLLVSEICLGTMTFGNPVREPDAINLVHWALDHGINFIDTADIYEGYDRYLGSPGGVAETILGKALEGRRDKAIVTTKAGNPVSNGSAEVRKGLSRAHIETQLESSLRRLRMDHVNIFEFHRPDPETPLAESIETIVRLIHSGKVRHWGLSNYDASQIREVLSICDREKWARPVVLQPPYSWLKRDIEKDTLPLCEESKIAVTPYQPLQSGLLTGKYRAGAAPPANTRAAESKWLLPPDETLQTKLSEFETEARTAGLSPARYALHWLLQRSAITSVVVGVKTIAQLEQLL